jgi:hypothetical protein
METHKELLLKLTESLRENGDFFGATVLLEEAVEGNDIPAAHLAKIRKWTQKDIPAESIHTYPILMIDTAPTRNGVIYTAESQKKTAKKWIGTTFLFNHKAEGGGLFGQSDHTLQAASQMGRLYDAKVVQTPKGEIGTLGWMYTVEGIDAATDATIKKLDAGILREVSIHVTVPDGVECSICNDSFDKCFENSKTDHYPMQKYGSKTCYMSTGTGALGPLELSAVACPGSTNAHVMPDEEVGDYKVVSLREALGGSREVIDTIRQETNMKTPEQIAEGRNKLKEAAAAAGVTIKAFAENADNKKLLEDADVTLETVETTFPESVKCEKCEHVSHEGTACPVDGCECGNMEAKKQDPPEDQKNGKGSKQSLIADDEVCVVCKREAHPKTEITASEALVTARAEFAEALTAVVAKSDAAIAAAQEAVTDANSRAEERDALFADVVSETVNMAVVLGKKKSEESESYRETLIALPYRAVREIRESYRADVTSVTKETTNKERLVVSMVERAKQNLGSTQVVTDEKTGRVSSTNTRKHSLGVKS